MNPNNACPLRITAAAGTELAGAFWNGTVKHRDYSPRRLFLPLNRALRLASLHHPRGVAASGFRPLRKILGCASRRGLGLISVPVRAATLSGRLPIEALASSYLTNKLIGRELILWRQLETEAVFHPRHLSVRDIMRY